MLKQLQQRTQHIGEQLFVDTNGGGIYNYMIRKSATGDVIRFFDLRKTFDSNALTIGRNGKLIPRDSADMTVNPEGAAFDLYNRMTVTAGVSQLYNRIFEKEP